MTQTALVDATGTVRQVGVIALVVDPADAETFRQATGLQIVEADSTAHVGGTWDGSQFTPPNLTVAVLQVLADSGDLTAPDVLASISPTVG